MSLTVDIKKKIGDFALDVSFEAAGGVSGILGASGSGKSMTLMCIAGIVKPDRGRIILNGVTLFDSERGINLAPRKRRAGYLFQNYALFPNMTVRQNIMCGLKSEKDKNRREAAYAEMVGLMRLGGLENRRPGQLSGGQQQRAALARILIGSPEILMLDEPFSALDGYLRGQLQVETQRLLKQFGKTAMIVTHDRDEAYRLCGGIALLDRGKVIAHKDTKQLFADPESRQAALLTGCKNVVEAVKTGEFEVEAPGWGIKLATRKPVQDGLCAIGIRAHYFSPEEPENRFPIVITDEIEGPFEYIFQFRFNNQTEDAQNVWWRVSKEKRMSSLPSWLGIAADNIMLLYK